MKNRNDHDGSGPFGAHHSPTIVVPGKTTRTIPRSFAFPIEAVRYPRWVPCNAVQRIVRRMALTINAVGTGKPSVTRRRSRLKRHDLRAIAEPSLELLLEFR